MDYLDNLIVGDARKMGRVPDGVIDLIVTSPPYNSSMNYDACDDNLDPKVYLRLLYDVWTECKRVLRPGGRIAINVPSGTGRSPYFSLAAHVTAQLDRLGFLHRGVVVWVKGEEGASANGSTAWGSWLSPSNPAFRDVHEVIIVACKDEYRLLPPQGPGTGVTDLTSEEFTAWTKSVWTFPTVSARRIGHPAPYPPELPKRLIKLLSYVGSTILDPFVGSGTTCVEAVRLGRHFVGVDASVGYITKASERVLHARKEVERGQEADGQEGQPEARVGRVAPRRAVGASGQVGQG